MIDNNEAKSYIIVVILIVMNQQECRGRSPLPGFGVSPKTSSFAAAGGTKKKRIRNLIIFENA
jgi:hypothetical protein